MDTERYSRQSYTVGQDVMLKLSQSKILIIGYSTVSLEIIRNLALLGINIIDIHHDFNLNKLERYQKTGLYYEKISAEEYSKKQVSLNPMGFVDTCIPIGWSFPVSGGDQVKYPQSKVLIEGPINNF